jgi:hypothetical protein
MEDIKLNVEELREKIKRYFEETPIEEIQKHMDEMGKWPCILCGVPAKDCKCELLKWSEEYANRANSLGGEISAKETK